MKLLSTPRCMVTGHPSAPKLRASPALRVALALVAAGFPGLVARTLAAVPMRAFPPVLTQKVDANVPHPGDQMRQFWLREVEAARERWREDYELRTDPAAIAAHARELQQAFRDAIGGLPERTPLHARTVGTLTRPGYRVDKVIFESQPGFHVTAALFLPDSPALPPPYPGVLVPCGHYQPAKAHDEYHSMGALLALHGMAALVFDPLDQGERIQILDMEGRARFWGTSAHTLADIQAIPLGHGIARYFIWDAMRAIDYLQSRPEVDASQIGCTGNSGGGTQACQCSPWTSAWTSPRRAATCTTWRRSSDTPQAMASNSSSASSPWASTIRTISSCEPPRL